LLPFPPLILKDSAWTVDNVNGLGGTMGLAIAWLLWRGLTTKVHYVERRCIAGYRAF